MSNKNLSITYFDIHGGRAEPARLAMIIGGIPFKDNRVPFQEWPQVRLNAPFHACPFLEVDGTTISQSNTINRYVGQLAGLYPEDPWQAALCGEALDAVEDVWVKVGATMGIQDPEALKKAREEFVSGPVTLYLKGFERMLERGGGEYFADGRLTMADLQVFVLCHALGSGQFDHVPTDIVAKVAPNVAEHAKRVKAVPAISDYYAKAFATK